MIIVFYDIHLLILTPNHNDMHDDTFNKDDWRWFEHLHWKTKKRYLFLIIKSIFSLLLFHKFSIFMTIFLFIIILNCLSKCFNSFYFFFAVLSSSNRDCYWKFLYGRSHSCKRQGKKENLRVLFDPIQCLWGFFVLLTCFLENYCDLWHVSQSEFRQRVKVLFVLIFGRFSRSCSKSSTKYRMKCVIFALKCYWNVCK